MKNLFLFLFCVLPILCFAQRKVKTDILQLSGTKVNQIVIDTTLAGVTDKDLASAKALKGYVDNRAGSAYSEVETDATLDGIGTAGDPLTVLSAPNSALLESQNGAYYLNYNNFSNTPTLSSPWTTTGDDLSYVTGNIGIGAEAAANANAPLQITGAQAQTYPALRIINTNAVIDTAAVGIEFSNYINATNDTQVKGLLGFLKTGTNSRGDFIFALNGSSNSTNVNLLADEKLRITYGGNVGIGTNNPLQKLDVRGSAIIEGDIQIGSANNVSIKNEQVGEFSIFTNNTEKMVIDVNGNVGIGVETPGAKLEIVQTSANSGFRSRLDESSIAFSGTQNNFFLTNEDDTDNNWSKFSFGGSANTSASASIACRFTNHTSAYGDLTFWTRSGGGYTEKLTILSGGKIGIGEDDPDSQLHIVGSGDILKLETTTDRDDGLNYIVFGDPTGEKASIGYKGTSDIFGIRNDMDSRMNFTNNGTVAISIADDGKVGINTQGPTKDLDVNGDIIADAFHTAATVFFSSGSGSPEGVLTAGIGSLYTNTAGGSGTTLYVKESGGGNTGWVAK
jgi:hypothetical protein